MNKYESIIMQIEWTIQAINNACYDSAKLQLEKLLEQLKHK